MQLPTFELLQLMCFHEYLYPSLVKVNVSSLIKRGQNWHLVLVQSLLVLEVVNDVKDLEHREGSR